MADIKAIAQRVDAMKHRAADRDNSMAKILMVRKGEMANVFPDMFPADLPHAVVIMAMPISISKFSVPPRSFPVAF